MVEMSKEHADAIKTDVGPHVLSNVVELPYYWVVVPFILMGGANSI